MKAMETVSIRYFSLNLGKTGSIRFPNDESCVMKYPTELALACWKKNGESDDKQIHYKIIKNAMILSTCLNWL